MPSLAFRKACAYLQGLVRLQKTRALAYIIARRLLTSVVLDPDAPAPHPLHSLSFSLFLSLLSTPLFTLEADYDNDEWDALV
ncbi:predicted protein [Plenodomus lingam JN3]|uniref:Predicted protein n=1 Tax=Leptosphaeria maculans (strain JN3 / isolate v23.1.3 / race Av1-4-5-6-7-8) TaxID=985895 RepID=E4ZVD9_LEPMJ|nr:predicted protein [Plenodomus lingam JN3]CBX95565.1 predicted protein [Plenodomus lingam JN3]